MLVYSPICIESAGRSTHTPSLWMREARKLVKGLWLGTKQAGITREIVGTRGDRYKAKKNKTKIVKNIHMP